MPYTIPAPFTSTPTSTVVLPTPVTLNATGPISIAQQHVLVDSSAGIPVVLTLPDVTTLGPGLRYPFNICWWTGAGAVSVAPFGGQTINGAGAPVVYVIVKQSITFVPNAAFTGWILE